MNRQALLACALAAVAAAAPASARAASVKLVAIVAAGGVRVPDEKPLRPYAARPWPSWPQAVGTLTPHGAQLITALGSYYRARYARQGLFAASGCNAGAYAFASAASAARASAQALLDGFAPGCNFGVDVAASPDPLFPVVNAAPAQSPNRDDLASDDVRALNDLDALLDCSSSGCRRVAKPVRLGIAADAVDALRMQYDDGLPGPHVGWGHLDRTLLGEFTRLPALRQRLGDRNAAARATASSLAAQLLATLQQAASGKAVAGARAPQRARFVAFVADADRVAALAGLLGASWTLPQSQTNDIPPGGALVFELHDPDRRGAEPYVRTFFAAQSDEAMRRAGASAVVPVSNVSIQLGVCAAQDCPLHDFEGAVRAAIGAAFVTPV